MKTVTDLFTGYRGVLYILPTRPTTRLEDQKKKIEVKEGRGVKLGWVRGWYPCSKLGPDFYHLSTLTPISPTVQLPNVRVKTELKPKFSVFLSFQNI